MEIRWYSWRITILTYDADRGARRSIPAGKNRLTNITGTASATSVFVYDGDGNRVLTTVGTTTAYIGGHTEWNVTAQEMTRYYLAGGQRVAFQVIKRTDRVGFNHGSCFLGG